jgi:carbonic anhydrase
MCKPILGIDNRKNKNVRNTIKNIRNNSPILSEMEKNGEIKIAGAIYDMDNGKVSFLN